MKTLITAIVCSILAVIQISAQNENPYLSMGYEAPIMKEWKPKFPDTCMIIVNTDSTSEIGWVALNVTKKRISVFSRLGAELANDTLVIYSTNRWLTPDPAHQYHSPYLGMGNNWPNGVDPDGREFGEWLVDVENGNQTKVSNLGDDVGMDFVNYTRTHQDGAVEIIGSFAAKIGTWQGGLMSNNNNFMSQAAQMNIMKKRIYDGRAEFLSTSGAFIDNVGVSLTALGYRSTIVGGAGIPLIAFGQTMSLIGDVLTIGVDIYKDDKTSAALKVVSAVTSAAIVNQINNSPVLQPNDKLILSTGVELKVELAERIVQIYHNQK